VIRKILPPKQINRMLIWLMSLLCYHTGLMAQNQNPAESSASGSTLRVTHILGFEGISNNATGDVAIQGDALRFQKSEGSSAQIAIGSIQDVILGEDDKQMGGLKMTLVRSATPYGGGRVIGLFSHKKYDTLTLEYLDPNGGFHGAIFQLNKGQGQVLRNELEAVGAHVAAKHSGDQE
jgi:hypothetical protein